MVDVVISPIARKINTCKGVFMPIQNTKSKICLICKEKISNENFNAHFKECRKQRLEMEAKKIQGKLTPEEVKVYKKKGGCGCGKKKHS